ncbi:flavodoxin domain-containing protein [Methanofollis fontis]|nr:flavodoxin domain-containing protein [Methanofollis fontis]
MERTCVIYESTYGSTEEVAGAIAMVLGPARTVRTTEFTAAMREFDRFVIGTPIYNGDLSPLIREFVRANAGWLTHKPVAFFCTALNPARGRDYLKEVRELVDPEAPLVAFGGRLRVDRLSRDDRTALSLYARKTGWDLSDRDLIDMNAVTAFALALRERGEREGQMGEGEIRERVRTYLATHRTCVICTAHNNRVRATPVDYLFADDESTIFSEGGEKFVHLLCNPVVGLAVYDDHTGREDVSGLQVTGTARILRPGEPGHEEALRVRGITAGDLDIDLNVIRVHPERAELLNAAFKKEGYGFRQVCRFAPDQPSPHG